jgi:hypothetical protein
LFRLLILRFILNQFTKKAGKTFSFNLNNCPFGIGKADLPVFILKTGT